jgi:hypothetical protein
LSLSIQPVLTRPLCTLLCIHPCSPYFPGLRPVYYTLHLAPFVLTQLVYAIIPSALPTLNCYQRFCLSPSFSSHLNFPLHANQLHLYRFFCSHLWFTL